MQEQEVKKEKLKVYSKVLEFVNVFDKDYNPLADVKTIRDNINNLMMMLFNIKWIIHTFIDDSHFDDSMS